MAQPSSGSVASQIGPVQFSRGSCLSALQANTASGAKTKQATNSRLRGSACAGSGSGPAAGVGCAVQRLANSSGSTSSGSGVATSRMFCSMRCRLNRAASVKRPPPWKRNDAQSWV